MLFGFAFYTGAVESREIIVIEGQNFFKLEGGILIPAGMVIISEESLRGACVGGGIFDPNQAQYDSEKEDFYYSVTNNTDSQVIVSRTSADMEGLFCATPFNVLEPGECLRVYENDRFHSLASVTVNNQVLCDGWINKHLPFCEMSGSYELINKGQEENFNYSSEKYGMSLSDANTREDCENH